MATPSKDSVASRPRSIGDTVLIACIAVWGVAAIVLTLLVNQTQEITAVGIGIGVGTLVVAGIAFWRRSAVVAMLGTPTVLSIGLVVLAILEPNAADVFLASGALGLIITTSAAAIVSQMNRAEVLAIPKRKLHAAVTETLHAEEILTQIYENSMLSDSAKRVIFRKREIAMLHEAIEHDIAQGQYGAALTLCEDIANLFGQRETAEKFRQEIEHARREHYEAEINAAIGRLDHHLDDRNWAASHQEAGRIRRLFPDAHVLHEIDHRIEVARREHKADLESRFLEAAQHEDVEKAMSLLRELDRYLTQDEAAQYTEVAQGVVSKHRDNLGVQFKLAVNDHRWSEAAQIGTTIVQEFPNTKMADEVRSMIDLIRTRATQAAVSAQGG